MATALWPVLRYSGAASPSEFERVTPSTGLGTTASAGKARLSCRLRQPASRPIPQSAAPKIGRRGLVGGASMVRSKAVRSIHSEYVRSNILEPTIVTASHSNGITLAIIKLWRFPVDLIHSVVMRVPGLDPGIDPRIHHLCFPLPTLPRRSVLAESIVRHKHSRCCFRGLGWMRTVITPLIFALTSPPTEGAISRGLQHDIFRARVLSAFFAAF